MKRTFKVSSYSGTIIKAIDCVLLSLLLSVALVTLIRVESQLPRDFDRMVIIGLGIYFISALMTAKIQFKIKYHEFILPMSGIAIVSLATGLGLDPTFALYKMSTFAAFVYIWISGSNFRLKHDRILPTRNRFYWSLIGLSVIFYLLFPLKTLSGYDNITKLYFPIYCVVSLLNLNLVNMRSAYELMESKAINKDMNVSRFSTIALSVAVGLVLIAQIRMWSFAVHALVLLRDGVIVVLKWIVYPVALLVELLVGFIKSLRPETGEMEIIEGAMSANKKPFNPGTIQEGFEILPWMEVAFAIAAWIIIGSISLFILFKIYNRLSSKQMTVQNAGQEERTFVFSFKESLSELLKGRQRHKSDWEAISDPIRIQYRQALMAWKAQGYEKSLDQTPNEFLDALKLQTLETVTFENLTEDYNALRYGGKNDDYLSN